MEPVDPTVLDRPIRLGSSAPGTQAPDRQDDNSSPARTHARRAWIWGAGTIAIVSSMIAVWLAVHRRPDPDLLWQDAERTFLAGRWDRARTLLSQIERERTRTSLDWMLEAQLASAS